MFQAMAIVSQVETDDFYDKFYVQAKALLVEDADHAQIQLEDGHLRLPVHANPLTNVKAGINTFYMSGHGISPLEVGHCLTVLCFTKGEMS